MEFSEKWGKDIDIAVELALKDLKCTIDEVDVIVLEEPSNGFLGFGSKLAKVRVQKKISENNNLVDNKVKLNNIENIKNIEKSQEKQEKAQNVEDFQTKDESKKEIIDNSLEKISIKPNDLKEVTEHVTLDFLRETTKKMGLELNFKASMNEEYIYIDIEGKDASVIIGKRGQTLDSIQYLTSLVANKNREKYLRVVIDAKNYRRKREETLEALAKKLAYKVAKTGRRTKLEPMNPYERMVIHAALQNHKSVLTRSEGEEPYRRVIIEHK